MDNLIFIIYLVGILPGIDTFFVFCGVNLLSIPILLYIMALPEVVTDSDAWAVEDFVKMLKRVFTAGLVCIIISTVIPSKDSLYLMLAAYGIGEVSQSEDARRLSGKYLQVLESTLDKHLAKEE